MFLYYILIKVWYYSIRYKFNNTDFAPLLLWNIHRIENKRNKYYIKINFIKINTAGYVSSWIKIDIHSKDNIVWTISQI